MLPVLWSKLIIYTHIICNSAITSAPGHKQVATGYDVLWYGCTTGFTRTDLLSHT